MSNNQTTIAYQPCKIKALLVGITYNNSNSSYSTISTHLDIMNVKNSLLTSCPNTEIIILSDSMLNHDIITANPTKYNILQTLKNMVNATLPGYTLIFYFGGHGNQILVTNNDNNYQINDKYECIFSEDEQEITDNELADVADNIVYGANFLMITDACFSGSILNLPILLTNNTSDYYKIGYNGGEIRSISSSQDNQVSWESNLFGGYGTLGLLNIVSNIGGWTVFLQQLFSHDTAVLTSLKTSINFHMHNNMKTNNVMQMQNNDMQNKIDAYMTFWQKMLHYSNTSINTTFILLQASVHFHLTLEQTTEEFYFDVDESNLNDTCEDKEIIIKEQDINILKLKLEELKKEILPFNQQANIGVRFSSQKNTSDYYELNNTNSNRRRMK